VNSEQIGRPRAVVADLPAYRPGKGARQAEAEHGITGAIKLASNENPSPPLDPIVEAIAAAATSVNRYADHRATPVREAIAARMGLAVEQVTVGSGSSGLLQQLCFAYVDPGDEVVYPWRSFEVYPVFTRLMGGSSVQVPLTPDLAFDIDGLAAAVTDRTKLVFLATPNNPVGTAAATSDLRRLVEQVPPSVVVCIDEAYREFLDPAYGDPVTDLVPVHPNVIVTRTFSKAHGLAGLRVGYAIGHPEVVATVDKVLLPFAVNALAQAAAVAALEHEHVVAESVRAIVAERVRVETELAAAGWTFPDHQGNFVWLATGERTDDVALGLERRGVVVRPFSGEGIRVTIGSPSENDRFLATLSEVTSVPGDGPR
jgi:histidinol-phosphate aminotransferase